MDWKARTVLVTGAGGFIGSHLTERMVALGARTRALIRYNSAGSSGWLDQSPVQQDVDVVMGDIRDFDSLRRAFRDVDIVFHLAALIGIPYSYHTPLSYVRTNVEGTSNVLQAALDNDVARVVHTSTSEVYGTAQYTPIDEDHPLQGQSPYSASKIGADKLAEAFHLSYGLPVAIIRPFNTYGPRQSARAVIPTIATQAATQDAVRLGNLETTRDFSYVTDTVEGFVRIAESPGALGQVINIGSGQEISVQDLAASVIGLLDKDVPIVRENERVRPENSEVGRLCADNAKARDLLGWRPRTSLEEGLSRTTKWIEDNLEKYRTEIYTV